jgi:hypothetical protein
MYFNGISFKKLMLNKSKNKKLAKNAVLLARLVVAISSENKGKFNSLDNIMKRPNNKKIKKIISFILKFISRRKLLFGYLR